MNNPWPHETLIRHEVGSISHFHYEGETREEHISPDFYYWVTLITTRKGSE